jgi:hypothetical protein
VTLIACGLICSTRDSSADEAGPPPSNLANGTRSGNVNSPEVCNFLARRGISENAWYTTTANASTSGLCATIGDLDCAI